MKIKSYKQLEENKTFQKGLGKSPNIWKLNNILLSNTGILEEINGEIRKYLELNEKSKHNI